MIYSPQQKLLDDLHDLEQLLIAAHRRLDNRGIPRQPKPFNLEDNNDSDPTDS